MDGEIDFNKITETLDQLISGKSKNTTAKSALKWI
jgi:hypothetical protein